MCASEEIDEMNGTILVGWIEGEEDRQIHEN